MNFKNFRVANQQDHLGYDLSQTALVAEFPVTNVAGFVGRLAMSTVNGSVDGVLKHFHNCEVCTVLAESDNTTVIFFGEDGHFASMSKETDPYGSHERDGLASSIDCLEQIDVEGLISRGFKGPFII